MRLIISDESEEFLTPFCHYLDFKGIEYLFEKSGDTWGVWIVNEDFIEEAKAIFQDYKENPKDTRYQKKLRIPPMRLEPKAPPKNSKRITFKPNFASSSAAPKFGRITLFIVLLSILFTFFGNLSLPTYEGIGPKPTIQSELMYDSDLTWPGYYNLFIAALPTHHVIEAIKSYPPPFTAFLEGDWWRLFTPTLLHSNILHLFFNMLWLILLGNQIEWHLGRGKYIFMILLLGVFSNTCQYLVSGAAFLGFSGVISGLFTFIWFRQKFAAWEGYMLAPATALFLTIFLLGMAALEAFSFASIILNTYGIIPFSIPSNGVANTAHLSGALLGIALAKWNFFRQKHT